MAYSKRITKQERKAIKSARRQDKTIKSGETHKQLAAVRRGGK